MACPDVPNPQTPMGIVCDKLRELFFMIFSVTTELHHRNRSLQILNFSLLLAYGSADGG